MSEPHLSLDQVLAQRQGEAVVNVDEPYEKLLVMALGGERFALSGQDVREVLAECQVFFLPGCPETLEGVINVRGDIESVIDFRLLLGYPATHKRPEGRILLCQAAGMRSGVRVDAVEDVLDVPQSAIQAPPHTIPERRKTIVRGVLSLNGRMVTFLNLERIFADYQAGLG